MKVKLLDLYILKICNKMYYVSKVLYLLLIFIITKFINESEFLLIYKLLLFIYLLIYIINLMAIKIRQFDVFFIANRNRVFVNYLKLILIELLYLLIIVTPVLYKFDYNALLTLYLFNIYYFLLVIFIFISSAKLGGLYSIVIIMGLIVNVILNYDKLNIILLNIQLIDNIYLTSDIYYNFLFLTLSIIFSYICYKNTSFRNIF